MQPVAFSLRTFRRAGALLLTWTGALPLSFAAMRAGDPADASARVFG
jgi:hypothetical protein